MWWLVAVASAQVKVLESAGEDVQTAGPTLVRFVLHEREKRPSVPVYLSTRSRWPSRPAEARRRPPPA